MKIKQIKKLAFLALLLVVPVFVSAKGGIEPTGSNFDLSQDILDLRVKVLGGHVDVTRFWNGSGWEWNKRWDTPWKVNDLVIRRSRTHYTYSHMDGEYMVFQDRTGNKILTKPWHIENRTDEAIWIGRNGDSIEFSTVGFSYTDSEGIVHNKTPKLKSYTSRNGVTVKFELDSSGNIYRILDHNNNLVLTYTWTNGLLTRISDYQGREVNYSYDQAGKLTELTDVRGEIWKYGNGTQEDPNGNIAKYVRDGVLDKHTKKKRVSEITFPDGKVVTKDYQYDDKTGLSYETEKHSTGLFVETWNDIQGREKKKRVNGELVSTTDYTSSENKPFVLAGVSSFDAEDNDKANAGYCTITGGLPLWQRSSARGIPGRVVKIPPPMYMGCSNKHIALSGGDPNSPSYEHDLALAELKNREDPIVRRNPDAAQPQAYIKIKTVTDVSGNKTSHEYDQWNNEVKVTYPDGSSISRTWHAKYDVLLTETNEKGIVTAYDYDAKGNLLTLTEAKGTGDERITRYTYDEFGQVKTVTTGESAANNTALATASYEYDQYGNITKITDPEGNITTYSDYDALGNAKTITDARSNLLAVADQYTWKNTYDNAGNLLTRLDPYGKGENYTYNKIGHLESITSASGSKVTLTTNANGQPLTMTDDNGKITKIEYDKAGRLTFTTDANGNKTQTIYDSQGRLLRTVDGEGNTTQFNYAETLLRSIQYPTYKEVLEYDSRNRLKQSTQQANSRNYLRKRGYDLTGSVSTSTDAQEKETGYEYSALNRVKKVTDAEGGITEFTYDARDNLLQVKDPEGRLTIYTYDKNDRLLTETKGGDQNTNKQRRYGYDQNGNLTSSINPEQEKTIYEFDQANRLVKTQVFANKDHAHPIKVITYNFNEKNHLTGWSQQPSATLPEGIAPTADVISLSETYNYNNLEQLESVSVNFGAFTKTYSYTYYPNGLKKTYTNPEGIIYTYYYNKNNQLMAVHIPGEGQISWANFEWMVPQTLLLPGGQKISLKYDDFQQMEERVLKKADNTELAKAVYEYDLEQNIKKIEKTEGTFTYNYDDLYRLTTADAPSGYAANDETFDYDGVGNRTSRNENGASESQTYNQKNQLQEIDSSDNTRDANYTYNANGHTKTQTKNGVVTEYVYNHEERLIAVKRDGNTIADYAYNPHGQRVKKTANGTTTWYFYNENGLAAEYSSTGQLLKEYHFHPQKTWMTDPLFQRTIAGELYYYHNDHLGTPQQLVDDAGNVVWSAQYSAFGKAYITVSTVENNLRFPGQYFDEETGLHQNYFRDYDADTGRYLQEDPLGIASSINYYAYAYQNPLSFTDPTGEIVPIVAAYLRCVLQCMAIDAAMNVVNPNPCYSPDESAKACALDCINPLNWIRKGGGSGGPPVIPLRNGGKNTHTAKGEQYGSYTITYPDGSRYHGKGPRSRADQSNEQHGGGGTVDWTPSKNEREAFKDESRRMDQDELRHGDPNNHNQRASPGDAYREQDGETLPGGGGSNFNEPGGKPGGKPGGRPGGKPGGGSSGCDC